MITWDDFERIDLRVGRIVRCEDFPEARRLAYRLTVDFGPEIGTKKSSAQITDLYAREDLEGKLVIAVTNLPPKQIGPFVSECLVTGFVTGTGVVLAVSDGDVPLGTRLA